MSEKNPMENMGMPQPQKTGKQIQERIENVSVEEMIDDYKKWFNSHKKEAQEQKDFLKRCLQEMRELTQEEIDELASRGPDDKPGLYAFSDDEDDKSYVGLTEISNMMEVLKNTGYTKKVIQDIINNNTYHNHDYDINDVNDFGLMERINVIPSDEDDNDVYFRVTPDVRQNNETSWNEYNSECRNLLVDLYKSNKIKKLWTDKSKNQKEKE